MSLKNIAVFVVLVISFFLLPTLIHAAEDKTILAPPKINLPIPTLPSFSGIEVTPGQDVSIPWIAQYIIALYRYGLIIGSVLTAIALMISGILYLSAGGLPQNIQTAKSIAFGAVTGLCLIIFAYLILDIINPNLTNLKALEISTLKGQTLPYEPSGDTEDALSAVPYAPANLLCPKSGGVEKVPEIIASLKNVMYYRFGGKGGAPPYSEKKPEFMKYNDFCPGICLDCSGFVNYVLKCAGLPAPGGGTGNIFSNAEKIDMLTVQSGNIIINGIPLKSGDLVGWKAGESGKEIGHVLMYVGNGELAESHGGDSGRKNGSLKQGVPSEEIKKAIKWVKRL